jgi:hypothetical protein
MRSEIIGERHEPQGATSDAEESALGITSKIASFARSFLYSSAS